MIAWKPIETAPKDGQTILGRSYTGDVYQDVFTRWDKDRGAWIHEDGGGEYPAYEPKEWIPAPDGFERDVAASRARFKPE